MPSNCLVLCRPLLLLPSIFPSIRVFSSVSALHIRWSKYWSFSTSPSNEYSGLISFRTDWFDLLAVQGTLKSLLQHQNTKASILRHSAFFNLTSIHDSLILTSQKSHLLLIFFFFTLKEGKYKSVGQCDLKCVLSSVFRKFILLMLITEQQEKALRITDKSVQPQKLLSSQIYSEKDR